MGTRRDGVVMNLKHCGECSYFNYDYNERYWCGLIETEPNNDAGICFDCIIQSEDHVEEIERKNPLLSAEMK